MSKRQDMGDFEVHNSGDPGPEQDAPRERTRRPRARVGNGGPTPGTGPVVPGSVAPAIPDGQMAQFRFADGVTLEFHIPHAVGVGGGGVAEHAVPWFVLRGADHGVLHEGPLRGVA